MGRKRLLQLRGAGRIVSVEKTGVGVMLDDSDGAGPDVVLHTGLLFGNVARDASGLLDAAEFPHSQDFNGVSTELNRIIEQRVLQPLAQQAKIGGQIEFVGCAELSDTKSDPRPLTVIPLQVNLEPPR
jgi:predicted lipoprotein